jgi:hypothetical protein
MQRSLLHLTLLVSSLFAACSDNDLDVGAIDAAPSDGTGSGSGGSSGGRDGGGLVSQTSDTSGASRVACDPLALAPKPLTLGTILGVGKSADGTVYVVDQVGDSAQRVFVSDAEGALVRQHVGGSGTSSDGVATEYDFSAADPLPAFVLELYVPKTGAIRMGVVQGTLKDQKSFVIGQDGEELTVLPSSTIASMSLKNFPGTVQIEYAATLPDGRLLLVTRPTDEMTYSDFRLYLGPTESIAERVVASVSRALDGGTTSILFDIDGAQATAYFPVVRVDASFAPGPATLTLGESTLTLIRQYALPVGNYLCL